MRRYGHPVDVSNVINLTLVAVTAVGVGLAFWQALDARHARDEARRARDAAKDHEDRALAAAENSASAAGRSAIALEEANVLTRSQIPTDPWELTKQGKERYEVRNVSGEVMFAVDLDDLGGANDITPFDDLPKDVGPNESLFFIYSKTFASPAQTTLQVSWGDPLTGERSNWRRTIS